MEKEKGGISVERLTEKPAFNADSAEEYFSDLLAYYRKTANDIFQRDNEGRHASNQTYSAEYQKYVGMQIAMREVLEYFSKYDLCEWMTETPTQRLRELVEADRDGRCVVLPIVEERSMKSMADGLQDVFNEWAYEDASVGLVGMSDGEKELAQAILAALKGDQHGKT